MEKLPIYKINKFNCQTSENDLYINDFKTHLIENSFIEKLHSHNFYLLVFFTKGNGLHSIDFNQYEIKPGTVYLLNPGQIHSWQLSEDIDGYIVFYSLEVYNLYFGKKKIEDYPFFSSLRNSPEIILNNQQIVDIKTYFELLIHENHQKEFKKTDKLLNLIDIIHIELARIYTLSTNHDIHSYHLKIKELEDLVALFFKHQKLPSFYADKMNITLKHLNRICKNVLNTTATDFIYGKVILESKRLLSTQKQTISEVADEMGFENHSYFTIVFKKYAGVTPQQFKKGISVLN